VVAASIPVSLTDSNAMLERLRVEPGAAPGIAGRDPRDTLGFADKQAAKKRRGELVERLGVFQQRLFAEGKRSLLLVLQGIDASGKDGVIRAVFAGANLQGCRVVSFRKPSELELSHDYLWRVHLRLPARGEIGIFNRSHYEDVVTVRLFRLAPEEVWRRRTGHIREWERMLVDEGMTLVKVFLNVSKDEQRDRLQERIDDPEKRWKFRRDDLKLRERFDEVIAAYEEAILETSTEWAPWNVVPADRNWVKSTAVAALLVDALELIDPKLPEPEPGLEGLRVT
jgi:PPK2 family polyphosphate:nucleotide phosphotransferase